MANIFWSTLDAFATHILELEPILVHILDYMRSTVDRIGAAQFVYISSSS